MAKVADFRPPSGGPKSPIFTTFPPPAPRAMDQFSCSAEILIVYAPRKFLDNHFMIVRGRAEPRHRADVRVMNVFTLMTPTLCTARRSEKHPTGPTSGLHQFLCARILAHPPPAPPPPPPFPPKNGLFWPSQGTPFAQGAKTRNSRKMAFWPFSQILPFFRAEYIIWA